MINNLESTSLCDIKYKIVFLGDMAVGKSSIIERFINGNFDQHRQDTVGIDFLSKNVNHNNRLYRLLLWDTAGQEKFRSLIPAYLRDAHCAVLVYDITREQSFNDLRNWLDVFSNYKRNDAIILIVGNKTDLKDSRKVSQQTGFEFAQQKGISYCQASAKKGEGIDVLFESIIENILIHKDNQEEKEDYCEPIQSTQRFERSSELRMNKKTTVSVNEMKKPATKSCCSI